MSVINSGLGWKCDSDYFVAEADAELAIVSTDTAYKALQGSAIAAQITNGNSTQLFLISTVENNAKLKMNSSLRTVYSVSVGGETWYISMSYMSGSVTSDYPLITASKGESLNDTTQENLAKIIAEITEAADVAFAKKIPTVEYIHQYVEGVEAETAARVNANKAAIGLLSDLTTTEKTDLVSAINELESTKQSKTNSEILTTRCKPYAKIFEPVTWNGLTDFFGNNVWTDGENIYHSNGSPQYVLDKSTSTWTSKTWNGFTRPYGNNVWTDGENIYYSSGTNHYVLNKSTSTWTTKTWSGFTSISGGSIWTDGENIYVSSGSNQYVLDKSTSTWTAKTWNGLTDFFGKNVWTDGENIYHSNGSSHYVLDKSTSTWTSKTWNGLTNFSGDKIWTDGENIYYSSGTNHYVLNKSTSTWTSKTWNGDFTYPADSAIWTDGENIYYSAGNSQYALKKYIIQAKK